MYHAKAAGKNRYAVFEPQMQDVLHERLRLEADIGRAPSPEQEFFLEYQPIVDLGHGQPARRGGVGSLGGNPEAGIPDAESVPSRSPRKCGQIVKLGRLGADGGVPRTVWRGEVCVAGGADLRHCRELSRGAICNTARVVAGCRRRSGQLGDWRLRIS